MTRRAGFLFSSFYFILRFGSEDLSLFFFLFWSIFLPSFTEFNRVRYLFSARTKVLLGFYWVLPGFDVFLLGLIVFYYF